MVYGVTVLRSRRTTSCPKSSPQVTISSRERPTGLDSRPLADDFVSLSKGICPQFPDSYASTYSRGIKQKRKNKFEEIGISKPRRDEVLDWASDHFREPFGWTDTFYGFDRAESARLRFFEGRDDIALVGVGIPEQCVESLADTTNENDAMPSG